MREMHRKEQIKEKKQRARDVTREIKKRERDVTREIMARETQLFLWPHTLAA